MSIASNLIVPIAAQKFGADPDNLSHLRDSANAIYEFTQDGQPFILRLTPSAARNIDMIHAEMDYIDYLSRNQGYVAHPVRSLDRKLVEVIGANDNCMYASVFEKVAGTHPENEAVTDEVMQMVGQALGNMHRLSKAYQPPGARRPHWHDIDVFQLVPEIPADQVLVRRRCAEMLEHLHTLPVDAENYGLIHGDPEPYNYLLHDGRLTFIDFDDSCYHWYAFDVAVAVQYLHICANLEEARVQAQHVWEQFYAGYQQENRLSDFWLDQIPLFLRLRVMEDYAFSEMTWDMNDLEDWQLGVLAWQRRVIEEDLEVLPVKFR
jgi:Ser/Thr protein kinase RdoA (MazF antagonist)